jgi:hypothetical protein
VVYGIYVPTGGSRLLSYIEIGDKMNNPIELEFYNEKNYLMVKVNARWTSNSIRYIIDEAKKEIVTRGYHYILIDLTFWDKPDTELTRFISGEYLAEVFKPPYKLSAYANSDMINKFGENTAVNRGSNFRIFINKENALRWLLEDH